MEVPVQPDQSTPTNWMVRGRGFAEALMYLVGTIAFAKGIWELFHQGDGRPIEWIQVMGFGVVAMLVPRISKMAVGKDGVSVETEAEREKEKLNSDNQNLVIGALNVRLLALEGSLDKTPKSDWYKKFKDLKNTGLSRKVDPWKGIADFEWKNDTRQLSAMVTRIGKSEIFEVQIELRGVGGNGPVVGPVGFLLHPTFPNQRVVIPPEECENGVALLSVKAWGAFTVGCYTDDGQTLELDLGEERWKAPAMFRNR